MSASRAAELRRIGANVRRARVKGRLTQERLAEGADLNVRTVQKIEAGQMDFLVTTAIRVRRAIGCSWDSLLGE